MRRHLSCPFKRPGSLGNLVRQRCLGHKYETRNLGAGADCERTIYDKWHNGDPSVVFMDGTHYMAYSATSEPYYKESATIWTACYCASWGDFPGRHSLDQDGSAVVDGGRNGQSGGIHQVCDFHHSCLRHHEGKWKLLVRLLEPSEWRMYGLRGENERGFDAPGAFRVKHDLVKAPLIKTGPIRK